MDPPHLDSIDGLGLRFEHLSRTGQRLALFRATQRMIANQLTDEQRAAIGDALTNAKNLSDANQRILAGLAGTAPTTPPAGAAQS